MQEIDKLIVEMRSKGATPDQLKPLEEKRKLLMYAVQYGDLWQMGGKEVARALFGMIKGKIGL